VHEVGHAGPAAEAEADHQHPRHHERVDHVRARPLPHQPRGRLHRVLQQSLSLVLRACMYIVVFDQQIEALHYRFTTSRVK
jgi:hypothetical protein